MLSCRGRAVLKTKHNINRKGEGRKTMGLTNLDLDTLRTQLGRGEDPGCSSVNRW